MDIFNRITPVYRTAATHARRAATSGGLTGLLGSLFGSGTPTYKTVGGSGVNVPAPSCGLFGSLFGSLLGSVAPSYKTAPVPAANVENLDDAPIDMDAGDGDLSSMPCMPTSDEVVLL